jgi:hypothetical protein
MNNVLVSLLKYLEVMRDGEDTILLFYFLEYLYLYQTSRSSYKQKY